MTKLFTNAVKNSILKMILPEQETEKKSDTAAIVAIVLSAVSLVISLITLIYVFFGDRIFAKFGCLGSDNDFYDDVDFYEDDDEALTF